MTKERKEKVASDIFDNPTISGNKLYEQTKKVGYGISKKDFYKIYRNIRKLPEPSVKKKTDSIPKKYIKPGVKIPKLPIVKYTQITSDQITGITEEGTYKKIKVITDIGTYWIVHKTKSKALAHLEKIKDVSKPKFILLIDWGTYNYIEYETPEMKVMKKMVGL